MRALLLCLLPLPLICTASTGEQVVMKKPYTPSLADLLTIETSASIWYSYARETEYSQRFENAGVKSTLLVPTNKAVMALARKPHQGPASLDTPIGMSEAEYDVKSRENVERWVSAHIIPKSPIHLPGQSYDTLLDGKSVSFSVIDGDDKPEWSRVLLNDQHRIVGMKEDPMVFCIWSMGL